ncbi:MAG: hypothetical protein MJ174_07545 [Treponema sp.]|nr:hypothetical protein [Treponema sp.]
MEKVKWDKDSITVKEMHPYKMLLKNLFKDVGKAIAHYKKTGKEDLNYLSAKSFLESDWGQSLQEWYRFLCEMEDDSDVRYKQKDKLAIKP